MNRTYPEDAPNATAWAPAGGPRDCDSPLKCGLCTLEDCLRCSQAQEHNPLAARRADFVPALEGDEEEEGNE
jgi:hypothetical protein